MQQFLKSTFVALQNIKANPLHTFLSTLGIIIGVASLVAILTLGDGLEETGRRQISQTTSLQSFRVASKTSKIVNDVRVTVEDAPKITLNNAREIQNQLAQRAVIEFVDSKSIEGSFQDSVMAFYLQGSMEQGLSFIPDSIKVGRFLTEDEVNEGAKKVVLSYGLADRWEENPDMLVGNFVTINNQSFEVIGILAETSQKMPRALIPISVFEDEFDSYPSIIMKVNNIEEIPEIKAEMEAWADSNFEQGREGFSFSSNEFRIEQFTQGILVFKLVMGAITGISVLVGGIGVMNVLLISVTERTKEIGIRKATGAKKKDIVFQFIAESVTISLVGCLCGWLLGIASVSIFIPIVNHFTDFDFEVAVKAGTVILTVAVGLFVGVIFGTYPAWRAAQLTPLDAIRHE
tara:strand:- start:9824 stop:11035 length:1212 start_codon:yes stop_codon:yes gene_type:complete